jgi:hypothetical protein
VGGSGELLSRVGHLHDVPWEHEEGLGRVLAFEHVSDYDDPSVARKEAGLATIGGREGECPSKVPECYREIRPSSGNPALERATVRWRPAGNTC